MSLSFKMCLILFHRRAYVGHLPTHKGKRLTHQTRCPVCNFDGATIDDSYRHFVEVLSDKSFALLASTNRERCKVCEKRGFKKEDRLRVHLSKHMEDAHQGNTHCQSCDEHFPTV